MAAGAEAAKRQLREVRGRTDAMAALSDGGVVALLHTLDVLLPSLTVPGVLVAFKNSLLLDPHMAFFRFPCYSWNYVACQ